MRYWFFMLLILAFASCEKDRPVATSLQDYINSNDSLTISGKLIACAVGGDSSSFDDAIKPVTVLYRPVPGAYDFAYFETSTLDGTFGDYSEYQKKTADRFSYFDGELGGFANREPIEEVWGIVTYKTPGKLHISSPIRIKYTEKPTEFNDSLLTVREIGTTPRFEWDDGRVDENVIYFQVITDTLGNFLSGTYTFDRLFRFYDTSNVVLNITSDPDPQLAPNSSYIFTLMAVSDDNWVNLLIEKRFDT